MQPTLSEYFKSKGQALPSVANRASDATKAGVTGAYTGTADQNNQLSSYYALQDKNNVPAAPKTPSAVIGPNIATDVLNNQILPTMNSANTQVSKFQQDQKDKAAADALAASKVIPVAKTPLTPEQEIMKQPDAGNQWIYSKDTGEKTQISINSQVPNSHTATDVVNGTPAESTYSTDSNITFKKFADGTYGQYDTKSGNYMGASNEDQYNSMKTGRSFKTAYEDAVKNGAMLNDGQKSELQSIADTYQGILTQRAVDNANFTGGTSVLQNLYGMGNSSVGMNAVKSAVDAGAAKITEINSKMKSDLAKMTQAFKSDNLAELKGAYDSFSRNSADLQKSIDTQKANAVQMQRDSKQQAATAIAQVDNDIRGLQNELTKAIGVTPQQSQAMQKALENHDYNAAFRAVGSSLTKADGWMGRYLDYSKAMDEKFPGSPKTDPMDFYAKEQLVNEQAKKLGNPTAIVPGGGNAPFQSTINTAISSISGDKAYTREEAKLNNLAVNGHYADLLFALKDRAKESAKLTAQNKTDLQNAETQTLSLNRMQNVLKAYEGAGGDMSYLKGKADTILSRFGKLETNPKYKAIATELTASFQQYRLDMTGAAFGASESAEYQAVRPGKGNDFNLNYALIQGQKNYMNGKVDDTYTAALGEGYLNLKGLVEAQRSNDPIKMQENAAQAVYNWEKANPAKIKERDNFVNGLETVLGRPISDIELLEQYPEYGIKTSFNTVGSDTNLASNSKVVGGIDLKGYAVDPNQSKAVASIYSKIPNTDNPADYTNYIKAKAPNSKISGNDIVQAANNYNLDPKILLALMQHESNIGTSTVALKNNNFGGITWSESYARNNPGVIKGSARPLNEGGHYVRFATPLDGLMAQAKLLNNRKIT